MTTTLELVLVLALYAFSRMKSELNGLTRARSRSTMESNANIASLNLPIGLYIISTFRAVGNQLAMFDTLVQ